MPGLTDVASLSAGYDHNLALKRDGTVWGWEKNDTFQLGQGRQDTRSKYCTTPLQVPGLDQVIAISASSGFSLALKEDGRVWAWGHNPSGELGDGKDSYTPKYSLHEETPFQVVNLGNVTAIDTGVDHSIALRSDGSVWTWGNNQLCTLGVGSADTEQHPIPVQVTNLTNVVVLGSGFANNSVIKMDGTVWIWGGNFGMQLCQGTMDFEPHAEPSQIQAFSGALAVDNSSTQTIAMMDGGIVWICGMMENGISSITEMRIPVLSSILAISAGEDHVIALDGDGNLWAWGKNSVGQLGDGTNNNRSDPGLVIFSLTSD